MRVPYREYVEQRLKGFEKQKKEAINERSEKKKRDEKYRRVVQSVEHAQNVITRQNPAGGRLLKKKMHAVKSMERRFQREDENMTEMPEIEEAIYFKLGDEDLGIPAGKTVIEYSLDKLWTPDGSRILAQNIFLAFEGRENLYHWQQRKRKDNTVKENIRGVVTEKGYSCRIYAAKL